VSYHPVIIIITCGTEARAHGAIIAILVDDVPQHVQLVLLGTQLRHRLLLQLASCLLLCFVQHSLNVLTELRFYVPLETKHFKRSSKPISWRSTEENKTNTTKAKNNTITK